MQTEKENLPPTPTTRRTLNATTAQIVAMSRLTAGCPGKEGKGKGPHEEINARGSDSAASVGTDTKARAAIVDCQWSDDDLWEAVEVEEVKAVEDGWTKK